jgi:hypothetical protein
MHFQLKNILKNNHYYNTKQTTITLNNVNNRLF